MPTVLLEPFGAIMRRGLRAILGEAHVIVADHHGAERIDAVLFDMDLPAPAAAALLLRALHPRARVIACSTHHPVMRIFDPQDAETECALTVLSLHAAVTTAPSSIADAMGDNVTAARTR
jgi:hypothetical protein